MSLDRSATGPGSDLMGTAGMRRGGASAAQLANQALGGLADGRLAQMPVAIRFWDGSMLTPRGHDDAPVVAANRRALAHLLHAPNQLGLARAWVDGSLSVQGDLDEVLAVRHEFDGISFSFEDRVRIAIAAVRLAGPSVLRRPAVPAIEAQTRHERRHSLARDRSSVRHHYDVSNEFYRLVLGPTMVYSCAYFSTGNETLEEAQKHKLDLICRKLRLSEGERLLDVGCGWGSLVMHAAAHYGVSAVGVTLSEPQAQLAQERVRELGLESRVEIRIADYRELTDPPFDKIASVGMYEHVGRAELPRYCETVNGLLRPGGLFLNHGIARLYSDEPEADTFISRYVFPDGELHPVTDLITALQSVGLEVRDTESLRDHYPITLRRWVTNLRARRSDAARLVGPERVRAWELYMLGSAQGFEDGEITVYQVLSARRGATPDLPLDRSALLAT
jgi:cyclopropane-fatty-acyl-phospholipid synthase